MPLLELQHICKQFSTKHGDVHAVRGIDLSIQAGEVLGLVGESGCGKSTLAKMVMQLLRPTEGKILLEGEDLSSLSSAALRQRRLDFQMVFQDPYASLNPRLNVFSTLAEAIKQRHGKLDKQELDQRVEQLLEKVGLAPQLKFRYPHEFSGGQRQRIAIARALAPEPKLILADEPVSALDVSVQSQILNLLRDLQKEFQLTLLFISHDLSVVRYLADRIAVMYAGELVELGEAEEVMDSPKHDYTKKLLSAVPQLKTS